MCKLHVVRTEETHIGLSLYQKFPRIEDALSISNNKAPCFLPMLRTNQLTSPSKLKHSKRRGKVNYLWNKTKKFQFVLPCSCSSEGKGKLRYRSWLSSGSSEASGLQWLVRGGRGPERRWQTSYRSMESEFQFIQHMFQKPIKFLAQSLHPLYIALQIQEIDKSEMGTVRGVWVIRRVNEGFGLSVDLGEAKIN